MEPKHHKLMLAASTPSPSRRGQAMPTRRQACTLRPLQIRRHHTWDPPQGLLQRMIVRMLHGARRHLAHLSMPLRQTHVGSTTPTSGSTFNAARSATSTLCGPCISRARASGVEKKSRSRNETGRLSLLRPVAVRPSSSRLRRSGWIMGIM